MGRAPHLDVVGQDFMEQVESKPGPAASVGVKELGEVAEVRGNVGGEMTACVRLWRGRAS